MSTTVPWVVRCDCGFRAETTAREVADALSSAHQNGHDVGVAAARAEAKQRCGLMDRLRAAFDAYAAGGDKTPAAHAVALVRELADEGEPPGWTIKMGTEEIAAFHGLPSMEARELVAEAFVMVWPEAGALIARQGATKARGARA